MLQVSRQKVERIDGPWIWVNINQVLVVERGTTLCFVFGGGESQQAPSPDERRARGPFWVEAVGGALG